MAQTITLLSTHRRTKWMSFFIFIISLQSYSLVAQESLEDQLKVYDRDEIHSIHRKLYTKEGRHELSLGIGGILNNNGYALVHAGYSYHLFENLALEGGLGAFGYQFKDSNKLMFYQAGLAFSPLYGKVSLFTWAVVNFDLYTVGGAGVAKYSGLASGSSFMGNIGIGVRSFINEYLSFRFEYRDFIYEQKVLTKSEILNAHTLLGGISIMLPLRQKY